MYTGKANDGCGVGGREHITRDIAAITQKSLIGDHGFNVATFSEEGSVIQDVVKAKGMIVMHVASDAAFASSLYTAVVESNEAKMSPSRFDFVTVCGFSLIHGCRDLHMQDLVLKLQVDRVRVCVPVCVCVCVWLISGPAGGRIVRAQGAHNK